MGYYFLTAQPCIIVDMTSTRPKPNNWFVYIAQTKSGYYYTGVSNDVPKRIKAHNSGKGSKFARMHSQFQLVYVSPAMTKSQALKREIEVKGWSKAKKYELIQGRPTTDV